jgi:FlaG/FlaF family flagellin (archaellin)
MRAAREKSEKSRMGNRRKRAESLWISFVLLMGFMVILSTIVYTWLVGYVRDSGADVKKVVYNYDKCDSLSVSIDNACLDSQTLAINVSNRNSLRIDALLLRAYDASGLPQVLQRNITIKPGKQKELKIGLNITNARKLQAVPMMYKDNLVIICNDRMASSEISLC